MSIKSKIKLSVVVAHYNREDIVLETLQSLQRQTLHEFECLIIDDYSNDSSPDIVKSFCLRDERFIYKRNEKNSGKCTSYNRGLELAKGEYIVFIDNDDLFNETYLSKLYYAIKDNRADMAVCNYNIWYCDTNEIVTPLLHPEIAGGGVKKRDTYIDKEWYTMFPPQVWTKIFKKEIIIKNNIKFLNVAREGNLFIHKYQYYSKKIAVVDEPLIKYRLFSDMSKHGSGGDYYKKSDVLYEMIKFGQMHIKKDQLQQKAWNLYVAKFVLEIYEQRAYNYRKKSLRVMLADWKEFIDIILDADLLEYHKSRDTNDTLLIKLKNIISGRYAIDCIDETYSYTIPWYRKITIKIKKTSFIIMVYWQSKMMKRRFNGDVLE